MKRLICLFLIGAMLFCMSGCIEIAESGEDKKADETTTETNNEEKNDETEESNEESNEEVIDADAPVWERKLELCDSFVNLYIELWEDCKDNGNELDKHELGDLGYYVSQKCISSKFYVENNLDKNSAEYKQFMEEYDVIYGRYLDAERTYLVG